MLGTRRVLAVTAFAGIAGSMLACATLELSIGSALAGLTFPLPFTLAGALFVLVPCFFVLRYSLGLSDRASCLGVLIAGTVAGWLLLGAPNDDILGPTGRLGATFGGCTALCWISAYGSGVLADRRSRGSESSMT